MIITNHLLAGALIGLGIHEPAVALPLAIASHFGMDALPHFGYPGQKGFVEVLRHKLSYQVGIATALSSVLVIIFLAIKMEWLALLSGLAVAAPDAIGVYNYRKYEKHGRKAEGLLRLFQVRFHRAIQWCERPWGVYPEALVCIIMALAVIKLS